MMMDRLEHNLNFASQALALRSQRQNLLAANIANADTPGYQARDIAFSTQLSRAINGSLPSPQGISLQLTSAQHIAGRGSASPSLTLLYRTPDQPSADGNTVDMDRERVAFAENSLQYQTDLTFLSNQIKWMTSAIQG